MKKLTQMERCTHKARFKAGYKANRNVPLWQCLDRLGQYEDTGLTPEQIREIDHLYSEKCREVAEYRKTAFTGMEMANIAIAMIKLQEYQDLEERGLLVRLSGEEADVKETGNGK